MPVSKPIGSNSIVLYCGFLLTVTAFSIDITLPAFGLMASDLGAPYSQIQMVVPVFILSAGIGQIFFGPASDSFGRKPLLLFGLGIYVTGALICFFAPFAELLLLGRAVQGFGAASGAVLGRAILKDLFAGNELARNMALATMIFAFGPIVAPILGVSIMALGSWRLIFLMILAFSTCLFLFAILRLPETNTAKNAEAIKPITIWKNSHTVFADQISRTYLLLAGPIMAMMIVILVTIPRVFKEQFGIEGAHFAILFALHGIGIIIGQIINRKIISTMGVNKALLIGASALFLIIILSLMLTLLNWINAYILSSCMILFATSYLVIVSNSSSLVIDRNGDIAGFVSSLLGFSGQLGSSIIAVILAHFIGGDLTTFILALMVLSGGVLSVLLWQNSQIWHHDHA